MTGDRKPRRDRLSESTRNKIESFWYSASTEYPCKKRVKKNKSLFVLTSAYVEVFQDFKRRHAAEKVGFIKFLQLRPTNVRKLKAAERMVCCCTKCENAKCIVQSLNPVCQHSQLPDLQIRGERALADLVVCDYTDLPQSDCINGTCKECGTKKVEAHYGALVDAVGDQPLKFNKWQTVHEENLCRDGHGGKKPN